MTVCRLDRNWLQQADVDSVERLVRETVNRTLAEVREQLVQQMLAGSLAGDDVASRIARLQSQMHEAFQHDLLRTSSRGRDRDPAPSGRRTNLSTDVVQCVQAAGLPWSASVHDESRHRAPAPHPGGRGRRRPVGSARLPRLG